MTQTETQTTKPLPCPFCGAEKIAIAEGSTYRWAHAECVECGAAAGDIRRQYGQGVDNSEVQEAAIAEWNTRDRREIDALTAQLAEARAAIERLRPAAALGDAYLASINEDADDNDIADLQDALEAAADRAREATK